MTSALARRRWRAACLAGAAVALVIALGPPLDRLAERNLSSHMFQHLLLLYAVPLLFVLGRPATTLRRGLPRRWRAPAHRLRRAWRDWMSPLPVWILSAAALWIWHVPALYDAALEHPFLHVAEHATYLGTSVAFWSVAIRRGRGLDPGWAALYVISAALPGTALGALLILASRPLFPFYAGHPGALADQQLGGLLMWLPPLVVYLLGASALFVRWVDHADAPGPRMTAMAVSALAVVVVVGSLAGCASGQRAAPSEVRGGIPDQGASAIGRYQCGSCHDIPGIKGAHGLVGPPLWKFKRRSFIAGELANTPENLMRWLRDPKGVEPGTDMPDLGVTERDARDITAYLYTLK